MQATARHGRDVGCVHVVHVRSTSLPECQCLHSTAFLWIQALPNDRECPKLPWLFYRSACAMGQAPGSPLHGLFLGIGDTAKQPMMAHWSHHFASRTECVWHTPRSAHCVQVEHHVLRPDEPHRQSCLEGLSHQGSQEKNIDLRIRLATRVVMQV